MDWLGVDRVVGLAALGVGVDYPCAQLSEQLSAHVHDASLRLVFFLLVHLSAPHIFTPPPG